MYDHIIVPFDGTARSLSASYMGADLCSMLGSKLVVLTAAGVDTSQGLQTLKDRAIDMSSERASIWIEAQAKPVKAIEKAASFRPNSLICMATHARSGVSRALFGSVAEEVVRSLDVPVLLMGPECDLGHAADIRQMIVCVDDTVTSEGAVPLAAAWANAFGLRCLLLSVVDREHSRPQADLERLRQTVQEFCPVEALELEGADTVGTIIDTTQRATGSILVMATHGRTGYDRFHHGSVVTEVVRHSPIPVLVQHGNASPDLDALRANALAPNDAAPPAPTIAPTIAPTTEPTIDR